MKNLAQLIREGYSLADATRRLSGAQKPVERVEPVEAPVEPEAVQSAQEPPLGAAEVPKRRSRKKKGGE